MITRSYNPSSLDLLSFWLALLRRRPDRGYGMSALFDP